MKVSELDKTKSFQVLRGSVPILLSAPHHVMQVRELQAKPLDLGTGALVLRTQNLANTFAIVKTKCVGVVGKTNDDANYEPNHPYKQQIVSLIKDHNIKAVLDIHSMKKSRTKMVNIGINGGKNIQNREDILALIVAEFELHGFLVFVDNPFYAPQNTVSGEVSEKTNTFCLQIEINSKYIHFKDIRNKRKLVANILANIVQILEENL